MPSGAAAAGLPRAAAAALANDDLTTAGAAGYTLALQFGRVSAAWTKTGTTWLTNRADLPRTRAATPLLEQETPSLLQAHT